MFGLDERGRLLSKEDRTAGGSAVADATHVKWLITGQCGYWAMSDDVSSGKAGEVKYYPPGVSTVLWLH